MRALPARAVRGVTCPHGGRGVQPGRVHRRIPGCGSEKVVWKSNLPAIIGAALVLIQRRPRRGKRQQACPLVPPHLLPFRIVVDGHARPANSPVGGGGRAGHRAVRAEAAAAEGPLAPRPAQAEAHLRPGGRAGRRAGGPVRGRISEERAGDGAAAEPRGLQPEADRRAPRVLRRDQAPRPHPGARLRSKRLVRRGH